MTYKALLSPKQFFSYMNVKYQAINGKFITDNPKVIEFLKDNPYWEIVKSNDKTEIKDTLKEEKKGKK